MSSGSDSDDVDDDRREENEQNQESDVAELKSPDDEEGEQEDEEDDGAQEQEETTDQRPKRQRTTKKQTIIESGDSGSDSDGDADWGKKKSGAPRKRGRPPISGAKGKKPNSAKRRKKTASSSDEDSDDEDEGELEEGELDDEPDVAVRKSAGGRRGGARKSMEQDDSDDSDDSMKFADGYDEEFVGDDDDRQRLAEMTEKEREQEIFRRLERREMLKTRFEIEKKLRKARKKGEDADQLGDDLRSSPGPGGSSPMEGGSKAVSKKRASRSSQKPMDISAAARRTTADRARETKSRAMQDLISKREEKRRAAENEAKKQPLKVDEVFKSSSSSSSSSGDSSSDSDSDSGASGRGKRSGYDAKAQADHAAKQREISTKEELARIRLSRFRLESFVHAPFFEKTVVGCFVRINIGQNDSKPVYRVAQVVDVVQTAKIYNLASATQRTNKGLRVKHGKDERVYRLAYLSNADFTDSEFNKWKETMKLQGLPLPTYEHLERKQLDIRAASIYKYSEDDIEKMVKEKNRFKKTPTNFAHRKAELMKHKEMAELSGDNEELLNVTQQLEELETEAQELDHKRNAKIRGIDAINQRNRLKNQTDAEQAVKNDAIDNDGGGDDPFTRRKTHSKLIVSKPSALRGGSPSVSSSPQLAPFIPPPSMAGIIAGQIPVVSSSTGSPDSAKPPMKSALRTSAVGGHYAEEFASGVASTSASRTPGASAAVASILSKRITAHSEPRVNKPAPAAKAADDPFSAHDFDLNIDIDLPTPAIGLSQSFKAVQSKDVSSSRQSLNLEEYKKRKGLI